MRNKFTKRVVFGALAAATVLLAGTAQAALQNRDLNGDGQTDAFYDTDLNITWLRNANLIGANGWQYSNSWADQLAFGGYSDWRLPTSNGCAGFNCTGSEMGHLWYSELGNVAANGLTNRGGFQNLQSAHYWSGTNYPTGTFELWWSFDMAGGFQNTDYYVYALYAMAVRDGDVAAAVPEPETYALMLGGLAALALARRQQRR